VIGGRISAPYRDTLARAEVLVGEKMGHDQESIKAADFIEVRRFYVW
jgi:hypothetical protein